MKIDTWFIVVFIIMWAAGPATQLLQLLAPKLHMKLGLMESDAFKPEFKWFLLDERGIAIGDMTFLVSGVAFIWLALLDNDTAIIFGLYSCACYVYFASFSIPRMLLLSRYDLFPAPKTYSGVFVIYMGAFLLFGLYGLFYLWMLARG